MILLLAICALALIAIAFILYGRKYYGVLETLGIPVIKPSFCLGSDPWGYDKVQHLEDIARMKKYGYVYGLYEGQCPQVHVCDPEMIKSIMVRDYEYFTNRQPAYFGDSFTNEVLDWLPGEKWKIVRSLMSSAYGATRVKYMADIMRQLVEEHVADLKKSCEGERIRFDIRKWISMVIVDMVGKCYCGIEFKNRKDPDNETIQYFKYMLGEHYKNNFMTSTFANSFPFFRRFYPIMPSDGIKKFKELIRGIISTRKAQNTSQLDYADILVTFMDRCSTPEYRKLGITEDTVICQAMEFFLASYDSSGTPINYLIYSLAKNPSVQNSLIREVDSTWIRFKGKMDHEAVNEMPYLNACMSESFRHVPAFIRAERLCNKDWEYNGIKIKKGLDVVFPLWAINRHPDCYEDPDAFRPERFMPENKSSLNQYAFTTFGHGLKNCIGQRWSYEMGKLIMPQLLNAFTIENRFDTEIVWKKGNGFIPQYAPIFVDLVKRE